MQASSAYNECMQYTLRNIPPALDRALRAKAKALGISLNQVALDALADGMNLGDEPIRFRDLRDLAGTWQDDPAFEAALEDQRRIDDELWR
jgi:hypothetical protein